MPADHHDERVGEVIEAFLDGPPERARREPRARTLPRRDKLRAVQGPVGLDTRRDWDMALSHEDARLARYRRPASVIVIRLRLSVPGVDDRYAARVGAIVREHARETDRVTRSAPDRFHVLLPETAAAEAEILAERVRVACVEHIQSRPGIALEVRAAAVSPATGETLHDALWAAQEAVAD
jgi:GGDEF domain-containing protein